MFQKRSIFLLGLIHVISFFKEGEALQYEDIVGGTNARPNQFTYLVAIYYKNLSLPNDASLICGGSIIKENLILSAAHCFVGSHGEFKNYSYYVQVGTTNLNFEIAFLVGVYSLYLHPDYDWTNHKNDIAILNLTEKMDLTRNSCLSRLELPKFNRPYNELIATISGYGFNWIDALNGLDNGTVYNGSSDNLLKHLPVRIIKDEECERESGQPVLETHICGKSIPGYPGEAKGPCIGDTGGPLIIGNEIIGVLSTISSNCNDTRLPSRYTRVPVVLDFILGFISKTQMFDVSFIKPLAGLKKTSTSKIKNFAKICARIF